MMIYEARFEMLDTTRFGEFIELHYVRKHTNDDAGVSKALQQYL